MKYIQKFRTIGFSKLLGDEEIYNFTAVNDSEKWIVYRPKEDRFFLFGPERNELEIRPEAKEQFLSARASFQNILWDILKNDGSFHLAKGEHYVIAYRREQKKDCSGEKYLYDRTERNDFYRFILFPGNGRVFHDLCTVDDLLDSFDFPTLAPPLTFAHAGQNNLAAIKEGSFPLYLSAGKHDRYLYLAMKYLAGIASQAEADRATAIDGKVRFVPEEKVYGDMVTVSNVEQIPPTFFNRSERYACSVTIDSRKWDATWWQGQHRLLIGQYAHSAGAFIEISDEIYDSLQSQAVKKYRHFDKK